MKQRQLNPWQVTWLKGVAPGVVITALLFITGMAGWPLAFSLQSYLLLAVTWLGGLGWALRSESDCKSEAQTEWQTLMGALVTLRAKEIDDARREVRRTSAVMREAVEGLHRSFHKLGVPAPGVQGAAHTALLAATNTFDTDISQAIRCLQFEDIATQSLSTAEEHLRRLDELDSLTKRAQEQAAQADPAQWQRLQADIAVFTAAQNTAGHKVFQESLADGDIELF